jgi:hypothetical protein
MHGPSQAGSEVVIPRLRAVIARSIVREIRSIQAAPLAAEATPEEAEGMAEEAAATAVAEAEAINATRRREKGSHVDPSQVWFLEPF